MRSATSVIEDKLNRLADQFRHHENIVAEHTQAMRIVEAQIRVLESVAAEVGKPVREAVETLERPLRQAEKVLSQATRKIEATVNGSIPDGLKPAEAVKALLRSHPGGMRQKEIVETLADRIDSDSDDKKRLLYNTVFNLRRRNIIHDIQGSDGERLIQLIDQN